VTGEYEVPTTLAVTEDELFAATYSQQGASLTLCVDGRTWICEVLALAQVQQGAAPRLLPLVNWRWLQIGFVPPIGTPTNVVATATKRGASLAITGTLSVAVTTGTAQAVTTATQHRLTGGLDFVYIEGASHAFLNDKFWGVEVESGGPLNRFIPVDPETGAYVTPFATGAGGTARVTRLNSDISNSYLVTAVDANDRESNRSALAVVDCNLFVTGAFNTITWDAVAGAERYRVYKERSDTGLYGLIGEAETTTFKDDNIAADLSKAPPIPDDSLGSAPDFTTLAVNPTNTPRAVTHYEGRRAFAGTRGDPQGFWATRSNTDYDLSYSLPIKATDRLRQQIKGKLSCTIRHLVPLGHLVALSDTTEFHLTPVDTEALTPDSFAARAQSYIGASKVQPVVVDNILLFAGSRGGRLYQMGYSTEANGYLPVDVC
jgi:hypothetical protein